jgi:hypothetical protein
MTLTVFITTLRQAFHQELTTKTSWRREELKLAFERAIPSTLANATKLQGSC